MIQITRRAITWPATVSLAATLAACGGGTANDQCSALDPSRSSSLPNCTASTAPATAPATAPVTTLAVTTLKLNLADAAGATMTTVTPQRAGVLQALLKDAGGKPLAGVTGKTYSVTD